ncbi:MAG: hypothetical protein ACT4NV_00165 [Rhodoferax sp.]
MSTVHPTTLALTACFLSAAVPVFFAKLRVIPVWLSLQALALGWFALGHENGMHALGSGLEILLLRCALVPWVLRTYLSRHETVANTDVMPSNLFAWGIAIALIIVAFRLGDGARTDLRALTLGVAAGVLTIAYLILATNREPFAQMVALLFMENAVVLFETLLPDPWPWPVHVLLTAVYLGTTAIGIWLMQAPSAALPAAREDAQ